jgi:hypothetical protein
MIRSPRVVFPLAGGFDQQAFPTAAVRARRMGGMAEKMADEQT